MNEIDRFTSCESRFRSGRPSQEEHRDRIATLWRTGGAFYGGDGRRRESFSPVVLKIERF